ncbi:unnamed protein product [Acanthoscelides obtectus]|nr:unnamed protein product [Acanthoscelides obtectus]CAK1638104.1 hypothetical protein AOBTE_LOCUS10388 [Acanthoscelides obtectus]
MNVKFGDLEEGTLLMELQELEKLRKQKEIVDDYMWKNLGKTKRTNSTLASKNKKEGSFLLHPKRLSDSESSESSSPKLNSSSSSASNFERDKDRLDTNTLNIKNNIKKLQKNYSHMSRNQITYDIDLDIGDSAQKKDDINNTRKENENRSNKIQTNNRSNNKNGPPPVPKIMITDDMFEKKCKSFIEKSLHVISDIRFQMQKGISPPDGDEDITRRQLRVKEFSNRFSRNYLYPIGRQLSDLSKVKSSSNLTNQKLLSVYQIVLNGLTAYHNHLPTSIGVCSSDKLKLLLKNLLELCDIHARIKTDNQHDFSDFINIFRQSAEFTIEKIEDHFFAISTESMSKAHATKNSLPQAKRTKHELSENNRAKKNDNLSARLSMYNTTSTYMRDAMWRKVTESAGSKKLRSVKSRYKTAAFWHRPPAEKVQGDTLRIPNSRCRLFTKKSSGILKKTPVMTPVNEDNITTMIQMEHMRSSVDDNE